MSLRDCATVASQYWTSQLPEEVERLKKVAFEEQLTERIVKEYENHWYPTQPSRGSGYRALACTEEAGLAPMIKNVAQKVGIEVPLVQQSFIKKICFVDPGSVTITDVEQPWLTRTLLGKPKVLTNSSSSSPSVTTTPNKKTSISTQLQQLQKQQQQQLQQQRQQKLKKLHQEQHQQHIIRMAAASAQREKENNPNMMIASTTPTAQYIRMRQQQTAPMHMLQHQQRAMIMQPYMKQQHYPQQPFSVVLDGYNPGTHPATSLM